MKDTVGMILCGGFGKRLRPVTETVPKPLVELKEDYTILDKQIFDFKSAGVNKVILLTGFLGEKIEERYGNEYMGVTIEYVKEEKPLGANAWQPAAWGLADYLGDEVTGQPGQSMGAYWLQTRG